METNGRNMASVEIISTLEKFDWGKLNKIYGCAHSSIIGFIAYEWLKCSRKNSVLDGAPSPETGSGRKGQQNSDLLLCKDQKPYIPIEVETSVAKYPSKLGTLFKYGEKFSDVEFGILYMSNFIRGNPKLRHQHNWDSIKTLVLNQSGANRKSIVLVSAIKSRIKFPIENKWSALLKRNDYSPWEIVCIDYWACDKNKTIIEGNFWNNVHK